MRLALRLAVVAAAVLSVVLAAAAGFVLWPRLDAPTDGDAVIVLSGDHGERLRAAVAMMERGQAPTLVLLGAPDFPAADALCSSDDSSRSYEVLCVRPHPDPNTRGQARAAAALAADRHWRTLVIVTSKRHVERARMLFDRCFSGELRVVGADAPPDVDLSRALHHEWLGLLHAAFLTRGC